MRIIIAPAKRMQEDLDSLPPRGMPIFLEKARMIQRTLQAMTGPELQRLWNCNDAIAEQNLERLEHMDLERRLTPAILAYEGIQYRYMAPGVLEWEQLDYIQEHLRIVSGFYGLLRPFDGVVPYRLEMQARLVVGGFQDLYAFWGTCLAQALAGETDFVLNLASKEYSRAVLPHLPTGINVITCLFGEVQGGKVVEKGTLCKMARGQMVRWLAEEGITQPEEIKAFRGLDYQFSPEYSTRETFTFLKKRRGRGSERNRRS